MTQLVDQPNPPAATAPDLVASIQRVLQESAEPLTLSKIRAALPAKFRGLSLEELADVLHRQAAANVVTQYPKYRSQQDRFWDRPMPVHVEYLVREALQEGPLGGSELRRKLPQYAQEQATAIVQEMANQGKLYRHPRTGRGGERYGVRPPDPKDYLRDELKAAFNRLAQLGFTREQLRAGALELLHDEEWESAPDQQAAAAHVAEQPQAAPPPVEGPPPATP
jgi:hypothetical protein